MGKDKLVQDIQRYIQATPKLAHLHLHKDTKVSFLAQGEYNINFIQIPRNINMYLESILAAN